MVRIMFSITDFELASAPLPILGLFSILVLMLLRWPIHRLSSKAAEQQEPEEKPFITPLPAPAPSDPSLTSPKPYRPFRHGRNFVTMGIRKLDWNEWIQMDANYLRYHDLKASELQKDFQSHVKYVDNAVTRLACHELYEELVRYLTHRYPDVYRLDGGKVHNSLTGEAFAFPAGVSFPFLLHGLLN